MSQATLSRSGQYLVGIDIGGTFTDCVVIDAHGAVHSVKVPSTPQDFAEGMIEALVAGAKSLGLDLTSFAVDPFSHGTTVGASDHSKPRRKGRLDYYPRTRTCAAYHARIPRFYRP
jgi:hypothetical protein